MTEVQGSRGFPDRICLAVVDGEVCGLSAGHPLHTNEAWEIPGMAEDGHEFIPGIPCPAGCDEGLEHTELARLSGHRPMPRLRNVTKAGVDSRGGKLMGHYETVYVRDPGEWAEYRAGALRHALTVTATKLTAEEQRLLSCGCAELTGNAKRFSRLVWLVMLASRRAAMLNQREEAQP